MACSGVVSSSGDCSPELLQAADGVGRARSRRSGDGKIRRCCPGDAQRRNKANRGKKRCWGRRSSGRSWALTGGNGGTAGSRSSSLAAYRLGFLGRIGEGWPGFIWTRRIGTNTTSFARIRSPNGIMLRISPPGELTLIGFLIVSTGNALLFTKVLDMNECDAPVSNKTNAVKELSGNVPITTSGKRRPGRGSIVAVAASTIQDP